MMFILIDYEFQSLLMFVRSKTGLSGELELMKLLIDPEKWEKEKQAVERKLNEWSYNINCHCNCLLLLAYSDLHHMVHF